jgi:hypothetical protein
MIIKRSTIILSIKNKTVTIIIINRNSMMNLKVNTETGIETAGYWNRKQL